VLNIYTDDSDIKNQIDAAAVTSERGLRCMMYIGTDETFTVYVVELQSLTMTMSMISVMKMMKSEL